MDFHPLRRLEDVKDAWLDIEHQRNQHMDRQLAHARAHPGPLHAFLPNELLAGGLDWLRSPGALPFRPVAPDPRAGAKRTLAHMARYKPTSTQLKKKVGRVEEDGSFSVKGGGIFDPDTGKIRRPYG